MMDKININLNPQKEQAESIVVQKVLGYTPFVVSGVVLAFGLIVLLNLIIFARARTCRKYKQEWAQWEDKYNQITGIKLQLQELAEETEVFQKAVTSRNQMGKIFEDIFTVLPENVWFKDLSFKENSLSLQGYVVTWEEDSLVSLVDRFVKSLKEREYFSSKFKKINLKQSQRKSFYGVDVLDYSIECTN